MRRLLGVALLAVVAWAAAVHLGWLGAPAPEPLGLRDRVTAFRLPVIGEPGRMLSLNDLRGKGVLLNFWATWCDPCVEELPLLARLEERYAGLHFAVVGVSDDRGKLLERFLTSTPLPYPTIHDPGGRLRARFGADALPFTVYVGPDGRIAGTHRGRLDEASAVQAIERLVVLARAHQRDAAASGGTPGHPQVPPPARSTSSDGVHRSGLEK